MILNSNDWNKASGGQSWWTFLWLAAFNPCWTNFQWSLRILPLHVQESPFLVSKDVVQALKEHHIIVVSCTKMLLRLWTLSCCFLIRICYRYNCHWLVWRYTVKKEYCTLPRFILIHTYVRDVVDFSPKLSFRTSRPAYFLPEWGEQRTEREV